MFSSPAPHNSFQVFHEIRNSAFLWLRGSLQVHLWRCLCWSTYLPTPAFKLFAIYPQSIIPLHFIHRDLQYLLIDWDPTYHALLCSSHCSHRCFLKNRAKAEACLRMSRGFRLLYSSNLNLDLWPYQSSFEEGDLGLEDLVQRLQY